MGWIAQRSRRGEHGGIVTDDGGIQASGDNRPRVDRVESRDVRFNRFRCRQHPVGDRHEGEHVEDPVASTDRKAFAAQNASEFGAQDVR